jgi:hypothetical protein
VQEHDAILVFDGVEMHVHHELEVDGELRQFEVVGCKQRVTAAALNQVAGNGLGQR